MNYGKLNIFSIRIIYQLIQITINQCKIRKIHLHEPSLGRFLVNVLTNSTRTDYRVIVIVNKEIRLDFQNPAIVQLHPRILGLKILKDFLNEFFISLIYLT